MSEIAIVVGTRPEVIKLLPVIKLLKASETRIKLISTGQQRDLLLSTFLEFSLTPDLDFNLMKSNQQPARFMQLALDSFNELFCDYRPDWLVVHGDTSTAAAAALSAFLNQIPTAHVEAGLRSGNTFSPFPEEANRRVIDSVSSLHFAPSRRAVANLISEGHGLTTTFTGNTIVDAVDFVLSQEKAIPIEVEKFMNQGKYIFITQHRRENFKTVLPMVVDIAFRLATKNDVRIIWSVHPNPNVQKLVRERLKGIPNILLVEPQDYFVTLVLLRNADLVVTDSGGIQEEAAILGVPLAITRKETERPEVLELPNVILVGDDGERLEKFMMTNQNASVRHEEFAFKDYGERGLTNQIISLLLS